ncbi:uncharacterized protein [Clytia hemisphaerica]|uniref:uncharacterized protein n=1 Tax=Clytia hemisphaerica TaxID=252671 RepID=UPI0034D62A99
MMEMSKLIIVCFFITFSLLEVHCNPFRRECKYPRKGHPLCPDGYLCMSILSCQCECPSYAPSYCCPPSKMVYPIKNVKELQGVLFEAAKNDPIEGKKFGKLLPAIISKKKISTDGGPPQRKKCTAPYPGTSACPEGYECMNSLKCDCECPYYPFTFCCPPSLTVPYNPYEMSQLLEKAVNHSNKTGVTGKGSKTVVSPQKKKKFSTATSNSVHKLKTDTWECLQFTKRSNFVQEIYTDLKVCRGRSIEDSLSRNIQSSFEISDEVMASRSGNYRTSKNQILKRLSKARAALDQCFKNNEPQCKKKTIPQFLSTHIVIHENKDGGFYVHSIENMDQQNTPYNVKLHIRNEKKVLRNVNNDIPQSPESIEQHSKEMFMVFKHSTGFKQDKGSQDIRQTTILGLFDRLLLSMVKSNVINMEKI